MMFNISDDYRATPITAAQAAYLGRLLTKRGKAKYQEAKIAVGIPVETTLLRLTKSQASRLIRELSGGQR